MAHKQVLSSSMCLCVSVRLCTCGYLGVFLFAWLVPYHTQVAEAGVIGSPSPSMVDGAQ